jgi:hypothetical protein
MRAAFEAGFKAGHRVLDALVLANLVQISLFCWQLSTPRIYLSLLGFQVFPQRLPQ